MLCVELNAESLVLSEQSRLEVKTTNKQGTRAAQKWLGLYDTNQFRKVSWSRKPMRSPIRMC